MNASRIDPLLGATVTMYLDASWRDPDGIAA